MNAPDRLANLRVNPEWAKLVLFDRKGWKRYRFDQIAENIRETTEPSRDDSETYIGLEHMDSGSLHIRRWGSATDLIGQKLRMRKGDILFARRNAYLRRVAIAPHDGLFSAHGMVLRARTEVVLHEFLPYLMLSSRFMDRAEQISVGSLSPTINWSTLKFEEFDLPSLEQQSKLACTLMMIDVVEEKYRELRDQLLQVRRTVIDEEVAQAAEARSVPCKAVMSMQNGRPFPSADYQQEPGIRLIRPGNLGIDGYLNWKSDATVYLPSKYGDTNKNWHIGPDQVLINLTAQSLDDGFMGRVCYTRQEDAGLLNQRIGRFVIREGFLPEFIFRCLQTKQFRDLVESRCEGSKVRHIYFRHFEDYPIPQVPLSRQRAICERVNSVEHAATAANAAHRRCVTQRSTFLGELFS